MALGAWVTARAATRTMNPPEVLRCLVDLERQLHKLEVRRDPERLGTLLHTEFEEIDRSGRRYSREEILSEFHGGKTLPEIHSEGFELTTIADGIVLLTYKSAHIGEDGTRHRWTYRTSLWVRREQRWKLRFHQGTPIEE
nr:DUF4440 domain-containing protein [Gammaproteobacteria bacterium]